MSARPVKRVLLMIEYGPNEGPGEVFDLTALAVEMLPQAAYNAHLEVKVQAERTYDYSKSPMEKGHKTVISFNGYAGEFVHGASHLDDVVNAALPDGERVTAIKKKVTRCLKKAESLRHDAMVAKLEQVAAIRHQHPIARVTSSPIAQLAGGVQ